MKELFYLLTIVAITYELFVFRAPARVHNFEKRIKMNTGKGNKPLKYQTAFAILTICYSLWTFVGLFTSQWPLFLLMFIFAIVIPKNLHTVFRQIDALLTAIVLFFIVINVYHLHIDVYNEILNYLWKKN